jgi:hypothetical protein
LLRLGRQHPPRDVLAIVVLFAGFCALAAAFLAFTESWLGMLLPLAYLIGLWGSMRTEVRELEIRPDALVVRTFFRSYTMPRPHIVRVVRTHLGPAVDVINGNRYTIAPVGVSHETVFGALEEWLTELRIEN